MSKMATANAIETTDHSRTLVGTWGVLVVLTLLSSWFRDHGLTASLALVVILGLTFVKVFLVGHQFMELRIAPEALQRSFLGWCAGTCVALVALALWL